MTFCYVPILKWKQGEQISLKEFPNPIRHCLMPIMELIPLKVPATTTFPAVLQNEIPKYVKIMKAAKFDTNPIGIDTTIIVPTGVHDVKLLAAICTRIKAGGVNVVPVLHPHMVFHGSADLPRLAAFDDFILRVRPSTLIPEQLQHLAAQVIANFLGKRLHVVLDTHDIVSTDPTALANSVIPFITALQTLGFVTTITFAGGSFPMSMQGIAQGTTHINRVEWQAYQPLKAQFPDLKFGDYSVTNPVLLDIPTPGVLNPSVQIRYTRANNWLIFKGAGAKTSGMHQYNGLCQLLVSHGDYMGPGFSFGDERYMHHAQPGSTSGSYMTWRRDATSHHVVYTTRQLKGEI